MSRITLVLTASDTASMEVLRSFSSCFSFDARKKIGSWKTEYNSRRPHNSLGYLTPDEFERQWQDASLSAAENMAVDQPCQGDPDGLRFAPALTRLLRSGLDTAAPRPRDLHLRKKSRKM